MEIILKKDVEGVGFKDDIVEVKNGFGRNFLIPNGSAILATPSAKKVLAENLRQRVIKDKKIIEDAKELEKIISKIKIKIKTPAICRCFFLKLIKFMLCRSHFQQKELETLNHYRFIREIIFWM